MSAPWHAYQYVVLRWVPRVEREEFLNVGVVLHCPELDFLQARTSFDEHRLRAVHRGVDPTAVLAALDHVDRLCAGRAQAGYEAGVRATAYGTREVREDASTRFGLVKAPRSTVIQPSPVHGGLTRDPAATLAHLLSTLVG